MLDRSEPMVNMELQVKVLEFLIIKLISIVSDDDLKNFKFTDDRLSYEISSFCLDNLYQGLDLDPFGVIVDL